MSSFSRNSLPKGRRMSFANWQEQSVVDFKSMKQRMLLIARDSLTNPYVTFNTWVNAHKRIPVSSLQLILQTSFFFLQNFPKTHFQEEPLPLVFSKVLYFMVNLRKTMHFWGQVWRKAKPSWKELALSLSLLTAQTAAETNSSCPTSSFKVCCFSF